MSKDETRQKILKGALKYFSSRGYDGTTVAAIAKYAGIRAPSLYNHFENKQEIFYAVLAESDRQIGIYTRDIYAEVDRSDNGVPMIFSLTEDQLAEKVKKLFLFALHDKTVSRVRKMLTIEQFRTKRLANTYTEKYIDNIIKLHTKLFKRFITAGELKNEDPAALATMCVLPIITLIGVCDRQPEREKECLKKADAHIRLFFRTFRARRY